MEASFFSNQGQRQRQQQQQDYGYSLNMPDSNGMLVVYALIGVSFLVLSGLIAALFFLTSSSKNKARNAKALNRMQRGRARQANNRNEDDDENEHDDEGEEEDNVDEENVEQANNGRQGLRQRKNRRKRLEDKEDETEQQQQQQQQDFHHVRKGTKYEAKMRRKEERRAANKALAEQREEQRLRDEEKEREEEERRKKEREEEKKLQQAIEERKREKERQEMEEYQQWRKLMMLEEAGDAYLDMKAFEERTDDLLKYVIERKSVSIQELAAEFGVKPADVVEKLQALEKSGRLTGVFDERGSYVYITSEEFAAVAKLISDRGRLTLKDITQLANTVIKPVQ